MKTLKCPKCGCKWWEIDQASFEDPDKPTVIKCAYCRHEEYL